MHQSILSLFFSCFLALYAQAQLQNTGSQKPPFEILHDQTKEYWFNQIEKRLQENELSNEENFTFSFVDLDGNKQVELITFSGDEHYKITRVFNLVFLENGNIQLKKIHQCNDAYSLILDLDKDGIPELLEPAVTPKFLAQFDSPLSPENASIQDYIETIFSTSPSSYSDVQAIHQKAEHEFSKIINDQDQKANYFQNSRLFFRMPIQILTYQDGKFVNATSFYKNHLEWKAAILEQIKNKTTTLQAKQFLDLVLKDTQLMLEK